MATYTIVNGSDRTLSSVNVGGTNVDPMSYKDAVTLTNTELATLLDGATFPGSGAKPDICVFADQNGVSAKERYKRAAALAAMYLSA